MEVYWANDEDLLEEFKFDLYVHLPSGPGMDWVLVDTYEFVDGDGPANGAGADGVIDFVVGNCQIDEADYQYPAWMDLPPGQFQMHVELAAAPSDLGTYLDVTLSGIPAGYDISNTTYGTWCGDLGHTISPGTTYTVQEAVSSLMPLPVGFHLSHTQLNQLNYMFNKLPNHFPDIDLFDMDAYQESIGHSDDWSEIQDAIWAITNNQTPTIGLAPAIYNDAITNGSNYKVLPGQWAAVLFWVGPSVQTLFVMVDP